MISRHPAFSSPVQAPATTPPHQRNIPSQAIPIIDLKYEENYLRTPLHALPFPYPKWGVDPRSGMAYEDVSLMVEDQYEEVLGGIDARESIEGREDVVNGGKRRSHIDGEEGSEERVVERKKVKMM